MVSIRPEWVPISAIVVGAHGAASSASAPQVRVGHAITITIELPIVLPIGLPVEFPIVLPIELPIVLPIVLPIELPIGLSGPVAH